MSARELVADRLVVVKEVAQGGRIVPVYVEANDDYAAPCAGANLPGSRLSDANVRCLTWQEDAIVAEAVVRIDHPGYIVAAWSDGEDAMHQLRAAVRSLVEHEMGFRSERAGEGR